jgi:hypothetical protein
VNDSTQGVGWLAFAGIMILIAAVLNAIWGIAAIDNANFFIEDKRFILSDLNTWGWILIVTGVVQGLTAIGVFMRTSGARWIGVAIAALNAIVQMFFISAYPFWALSLFTLDMLVIYGLVVHGARSSRA